MSGQSIMGIVGGIGGLVLCYVMIQAGRTPGMQPLWGAADEERSLILRMLRRGCMFGLALVCGLGGVLGLIGAFVAGNP
ncbi:MAG TPA: hypothetical protein VD886_01025 [Herpetosiphonaceae bacterium]|nr:hypothetical protein [Herpetosiphonaceae bacterium]